jgi:hypothetical protein
MSETEQQDLPVSDDIFVAPDNTKEPTEEESK